MTDILEQRLEPSRDAVESRVGEETVLLHLKSGTYFGIDAVGTRIWALLKDGMTPKDICERIADEYGVAPETAEADARQFLEDLKSNGIVEEA